MRCLRRNSVCLPPAKARSALKSGKIVRKSRTGSRRSITSKLRSPCTPNGRARALGGNCAIPLAAFAEWIEGILLLRACIAQPDGARFLRARACAAPNTLAEAETLGYTVADDLARQGAQEMVRAFSEQ